MQPDLLLRPVVDYMQLVMGHTQASFAGVLGMGVDYGGRPSPEFGVGALMQIVPSDFCHISTKRSVM